MRSLFLLICSLCGITPSTPLAAPCSCEPPGQEAVYAASSAVFVGEVIEIADSDVPLFKGYQPAPKSSFAVRFRVIEYWKGVKGPEVTVHSDLGALPCNQFGFVEGRKYLVYAEGINLIAITGCTRSRPVANDYYYWSELKRLGRSKKPKAKVERPGPPDKSINRTRNQQVFHL